MGDSSEETKIDQDRKENILRGRLRMRGHALRTKKPGERERPQALINPVVRGSGPTWHLVMLLSSFTHPAQSTGPESNRHNPKAVRSRMSAHTAERDPPRRDFRRRGRLDREHDRVAGLIRE